MVITLYISTLTHSAILHIALPPEAYRVRSSVKRDMRTIEQALYVARGYHLLRWAMHKVRSVYKSYAIGKRQRYVEFVRGEYHTLTLVVCQTAQQQTQLIAVWKVEERRRLVEEYNIGLLR